MTKRTHPEHGRSVAAGEAHGRTAAAERPPRLPHDRAKANGVDMRTKAMAGLGARAQAGTMLRLSRVMRNR